MTSPLTTIRKHAEALISAREKLPTRAWTYSKNPMRDDGYFAYGSYGECVTFAQVSEDTAHLICLAANSSHLIARALIEACEALEFYSDVSNYGPNRSNSSRRQISAKDTEHILNYPTGGKTARETLARVAKMLEGEK